jgi:hypothetical protein
MKEGELGPNITQIDSTPTINNRGINTESSSRHNPDYSQNSVMEEHLIVSFKNPHITDKMGEKRKRGDDTSSSTEEDDSEENLESTDNNKDSYKNTYSNARPAADRAKIIFTSNDPVDKKIAKISLRKSRKGRPALKEKMTKNPELVKYWLKNDGEDEDTVNKRFEDVRKLLEDIDAEQNQPGNATSSEKKNKNTIARRTCRHAKTNLTSTNPVDKKSGKISLRKSRKGRPALKEEMAKNPELVKKWLKNDGEDEDTVNRRFEDAKKLLEDIDAKQNQPGNADTTQDSSEEELERETTTSQTEGQLSKANTNEPIQDSSTKSTNRIEISNLLNPKLNKND